MAKSKGWLSALEGQGLEVKSSRDGLVPRGFLDSGNYGLNWAISGRFLRGYPLGHTVEIFGDPGTGKSFLIARAIAMAQEQGGVAMLDDTEGGHNLEHMEALGVQSEKLAYRRSRTVKEHLDAARAFTKAYTDLGIEKPGILVCDSLSLLSTEHELEVGLDKRDMTKARDLKAFFRIVGADFIDLPVVHISTSHAIATIGAFQKRTTSGGGGPKYQASIRLDLRATSKIKQGKEHLGVISRVVVDKNRIVAPWRETRLAIPFYQPVSPASGLIPILLQLGVLGVSGNYLTYQDEKLDIKVYKSKNNFLQQDESGERLLDEIPELLHEVDDWLDKGGKQHAPWADAQIVEEEEEEEEEPEEVEA